ncbi:MAG: TCR/Tet family MFS transporter [Candidatus Cyclobacteriaceae bacterium M3_2C_046]
MVKKQAALGFIFVTILIDSIGIGIIIPILPGLIEQLVGGGLSQASRYGGWLIFSYAIMQFLSAPIMGSLSDRVGRRPIILISLLGLGLDYVFHALAPSIFWLFIGRIIAGISGASFTTASAYMADISAPEKKAQNFGLIGAAFGLGFIIGPVIGGIFSQWGIRVPFLVAAGLSLINFIYGYFILPESLSAQNRRKFSWRKSNPVGALTHLKQYPLIAGLIISIFFIHIAAHAVQSTWSFFTMLRFEWDETLVGYSLGFVGVLVALVQGGLTRVTVPKLGYKNTIFLGMMLWISGLVLFAFASEGWMMFAFVIPYCLGGIAGPAIQGVISNQVPPNEQGQLQGALTSLISLTAIVGPLMMTNLFAYFTSADAYYYFPGAAFLLGALLILISFIFIVKSLSSKKLAFEYQKHENIN